MDSRIIVEILTAVEGIINSPFHKTDPGFAFRIKTVVVDKSFFEKLQAEGNQSADDVVLHQKAEGKEAHLIMGWRALK